MIETTWLSLVELSMYGNETGNRVLSHLHKTKAESINDRGPEKYLYFRRWLSLRVSRLDLSTFSQATSCKKVLLQLYQSAFQQHEGQFIGNRSAQCPSLLVSRCVLEGTQRSVQFWILRRKEHAVGLFGCCGILQSCIPCPMRNKVKEEAYCTKHNVDEADLH